MRQQRVALGPSVGAPDMRVPDETAERKPSRRSSRPRSIRVARSTRDERARAARRALELERELTRPRHRSECATGPRPCPYVACKHHLYLDVSPTTGTIKLNFPELEVWELTDSCALDVADEGPQPVERTSELLNVTRERIRQIEAVALARLATVRDVQRLRDVPEKGDPAFAATFSPRRMRAANALKPIK